MTLAVQDRDLTLERRVEERTNQLAEANQDLESFMYSVSHDLRAPLRAINGFSEFLFDEYNEQLSDEGKFYLERIMTNSITMDQLINDLIKSLPLRSAEFTARTDRDHPLGKRGN